MAVYMASLALAADELELYRQYCEWAQESLKTNQAVAETDLPVEMVILVSALGPGRPPGDDAIVDTARKQVAANRQPPQSVLSSLALGAILVRSGKPAEAMRILKPVVAAMTLMGSSAPPAQRDLVRLIQATAYAFLALAARESSQAEGRSAAEVGERLLTQLGEHELQPSALPVRWLGPLFLAQLRRIFEEAEQPMQAPSGQ